MKTSISDMLKEIHIDMLDQAHNIAVRKGGCAKVDVGSCIVTQSGDTIYGANVTLPFNCKTVGCRRIQLYGEDSKNHRLPEDCRAVHSEIDAITNAAQLGESTDGAVMYITRYPCEACARAIVRAGIKRVVYGRQQEISPETQLILFRGGIEVVWEKEWTREDTTR